MRAVLSRHARSRLIAAATCATAGWAAAPLMAQSTGNRSLGLDVSAWQETIDWVQVRNSGKDFAFIRSSRGGTTGTYDQSARTGTLSHRYDDPYFVANITAATSLGMFAGPYHFARPDIVANWPAPGQIPNDPVDEANHFLQQARPWMRPGYLLPVMDLESGQPNDPAGTPGRSSAQLSQFAVDFANRIKAVIGVAPFVYINQNYANYIDSSVPAAMPNNWVARWNGQGLPGYSYLDVDPHNDNPEPSPSTANVYGKWNPDYPTIPNSQPWPGEQPWKFWQYTSRGRVPGIGGGTVNVDLDVAHGGIEYVKDFLVPALWTRGSSGDWGTIANWNSDNPGHVAGNDATGPAPRLPGPNDTVILDNALSSGTYTVTLSSGTHAIRKLYVNQALNLTGGSLTVGYVPVAESTPISAQFSRNVSLSGTGALSAHTLLVDATRTLTLSGGSLTLNKLTLSPATSNAAKLVVSGDVSVNPLNNAAAVITSSLTGSQTSGTIDFGGANRTVTVGDGAADVDLTFDAPVSNGTLTKAGAGTLQLNKTATFSGPVTVNGGVLVATQNGQLGPTSVTVAQAGSLHLSGNLSYALPLTISGAGANGIPGVGGLPTPPGGPGTLHAASGNPTWSGTITVNGAGANGRDNGINQVSAASGAALTLSGAIVSGATGAFAKAGAGDLVLTGNTPNTYAGLTRLYGGRIIIEKDGALGTAANHAFQLAGSASTFAFRARAGTSGLTYATEEYIFTEGTGATGYAQVDNLSGNNTFAGSIGIGGPGDVGSIGVTAGSLTINGGIYSRLGATQRTINKTGTGTLILAGNSAATPATASALPLADSAMNVNAGTVDLRSPSPDAPNVPGLTTYTVNAGATLLNTAGTLGASITVNAGGTFRQTGGRLQDATLTVTDNGLAKFEASAAGASVVSWLAVAANGQLDLASNDLLVDHSGTSPAETVRQRLLSGRAAGAWNGKGIISSAAAADGQSRVAIGYAESSQLLGLTGSTTSTFSGMAVDATSLMMKHTWYGDANLDGVVNADDYVRLDRGFARSLTGWINGDFDYSGTVNSGDYLLIDRAFVLQSGVLSPDLLAEREAQFGDGYVAALVASVPEPAGAVLLVAAAAAGLSGRPSGRRRGPSESGDGSRPGGRPETARVPSRRP